MKEIRLGIVGAGWVAQKHLDVIAAMDGVSAAGITSRTLSKAQELAKQYKIPVCAPSMDELMESTSADALLILVSEDQIFSVTKAAIQYGKPLLIEKPAGLTPAENQELARLAGAKSIPTMVAFNRRYYSVFNKGMDIIRRHGPLLGVVIEGHERFWKVKAAGKFTPAILDAWIYANSTHVIDLLRYFGGEVEDVTSSRRSLREPGGDQFAALARLRNGAIGQYSAFWYSPGGWRVTLYGDGVTVDFKPLEQGTWTDKDFKTHTIEPDEVDVKFKPGFYGQMAAFVELVRTGTIRPPALDLQGAYETMALTKRIADTKGDL